MIDRIERRHAGRCVAAEQHGVLRVRVRPGHGATLLDLSSGGSAIETTRRLLPGALVELQLETLHQRTSVRGRVVRCEVVSVEPNRLLYRAAICFDEPLSPGLSPAPEYVLPIESSPGG